MMRSALNTLNAHSEQTAMVGDRMDTDIVAGIEAGLETFLVLTGVTDRAEAESYPYRSHRIVDSVANLIPEVEAAQERRRDRMASDGADGGDVIDLPSER